MLYQRQFGSPKIEVAKNFEVPHDKSRVFDSSNYDYDYDGLDLFDNPNSEVSSTLYHNNVLAPSSLYSKSNDDSELNSDKEVKELKALVNKHRKDHDSLYEVSEQNNNNLYANHDLNQKVEIDDEYDDWINWDKKRSSASKKVLPNNKKLTLDSKKPLSKSVVITATKPTSTSPKQTTIFLTTHHNGQKEVVLPRPAVPGKHSFQQPSFETNALQTSTAKITESKKKLSSQKPHSSGAIYDTIKQILRMEQNLDKVNFNTFSS